MVTPKNPENQKNQKNQGAYKASTPVLSILMKRRVSLGRGQKVKSLGEGAVKVILITSLPRPHPSTWVPGNIFEGSVMTLPYRLIAALAKIDPMFVFISFDITTNTSCKSTCSVYNGGT